MAASYDVIIVGARCAGASSALLLARKGYRVLLVDRATFPSDTLSTLAIQPRGVAALARWGLLEEVVASGCPAITNWSFDFGPVTIAGSPRPVDGVATAYAPRRTVLDTILVRAAAAAGAEVREGFSLGTVLVDEGRVVGIRGRTANGLPVDERARVVMGADGRNSAVARAVNPARYHEKPRLELSYYTYFSGLPVAGIETVVRPDRAWGAIPTNDGLTLLAVAWPMDEADAYRADVEGNYLATFDLLPAFAGRVRGATREARFMGGASPNFFRVPYGPGWALVGDAGHTADPIVPHGISDAFRDAELCTAALDQALSGAAAFDAAMAGYQETRDAEALPLYEFTTQMAALAPPPPELQSLIAAMAGNPAAMDAFVSLAAASMSPVEFFDPVHLGRMLRRAA